MSVGTIYERVIEFCRAAEPPAPWPRSDLGCQAYEAPPRPLDVFGRLELEFDSDALIESGLAQHGADGGLQPSERWPPPGTLVLPWRDAPDGPPVDLLVEGGNLRDDVLPILSALRDQRTRQSLIEQYGSLLIATNLADMAVLRGAGMAVTTADGLSDATSEQLAAIEAAWPECGPQTAEVSTAEAFPSAPEALPSAPEGDSADASRPDQERSAEPAVEPAESIEPAEQAEEEELAEQAVVRSSLMPPVDVDRRPMLVVAAWQPSLLSCAPPTNLTEVIGACAGACEATGNTVPWETCQWRPHPEEVDRLRRNLRAGTPVDLREWLLNDLCTSCYEPYRQVDVASDPPSLLAARAAYVDALSGRAGRPDAAHAHLVELRQSLEAAHDREIVQPFLARAQAVGNPIRRASYLAAANIARSMEQIAQELDDDRARGSSDLRGGRRSRVELLVRQQIRCTDALMRIYRELRR